MKRPFAKRVLTIMTVCVGGALCLGSAIGAEKKLRVFILAGQSNMVGHSLYRTVPALLDDPAPGAQEVAKLILKENATSVEDVRKMLQVGQAAGALKEKLKAKTIKGDAEIKAAELDLEKLEADYEARQTRVKEAFRVAERVHITSIADGNTGSGKLCFGYGGSREKLGPELGFGMSLEQKVDGPILLIKISWGGKSLHYDFRPPSAGVYPLNEKEQQFDNPETVKQIAQAKEAEKAWLAESKKAIKAFWVEHNKFMAKNLGKEDYAEWQTKVAEWDEGVTRNGGLDKLRPWMVWGLERRAQEYFEGIDIKAPTMDINNTLWKQRPKLADARTGDQIRADAGTCWRAMATQVHAVLKDLKAHHPDYDTSAGYEVAGFVWFQGFNDQFAAEYHGNYKSNMIAFIKDVRKEFGNPAMPFVIGVLGTGMTKDKVGENAVSVAQREAAADPRFKGTVKSVESYIYFDHKAAAMWMDRTWNAPEHRIEFQILASDRPYHYMGSGKLFTRLGDAMAMAMAELMEM